MHVHQVRGKGNSDLAIPVVSIFFSLYFYDSNHIIGYLTLPLSEACGFTIQSRPVIKSMKEIIFQLSVIPQLNAKGNMRCGPIGGNDQGCTASLVLIVCFLFSRYCLQPKDIWSWVEPYLEDEEVRGYG